MKEFFVAGVKFHKLDSVENEIEVGDLLKLEKEPTNKYDPNAVKIIYHSQIHNLDVMVGYVPGKLSAQATAMIETDDGSLKCEVVEVNFERQPWNRLLVRIS
jgi:hypothetical protein